MNRPEVKKVFSDRFKQVHKDKRYIWADRFTEWNKEKTKLGGNGRQLAKPQSTLLKALGLTEEFAEYPVPTKPIRSKNTSFPPCYKIDIALPDHKIAIECDGWGRNEEIDMKKDNALERLGWTVLRFKNEEILADVESVLHEIRIVICCTSFCRFDL
jgi:hypothetical protein